MGESVRSKRVVAAHDIPCGVMTKPFSFQNVISPFIVTEDGCLQVKVDGNKQLTINSQHEETFWPKLITLAQDCHMQNVRISKFDRTSVVLQTTRIIPAGQELHLWFSEEILYDVFNIPPYLSPSNIRGGNSYICQLCGKEFQAPNPLKLHLALNCGCQTVSELWNRFSKLIPNLDSTINIYVNNTAEQMQPLALNKMSTTFPSHLLITKDSESPQRSVLNLSGPRNHHNIKGDEPMDAKSLISDHYAHLESVVSNMGKAKNGHVCLYCGKLYSRKYGLKIHIRTHTGFKPLECKICHRPFGDPSNLNKHVRLHADGNTPYRCDFCGKVLVRRRDLDRHIRSRHADTLGISSVQNASVSTNLFMDSVSKPLNATVTSSSSHSG